MLFVKIENYFVIQSFFFTARCIHGFFKIQKISFRPYVLLLIEFKVETDLPFVLFFFFWIFSINIIFLRFLHLLLAFHLIRGTGYDLWEFYCLLFVGVKIKLSWFRRINSAVSRIIISVKLILTFLIIIFTILFSDLFIFIRWLRLIKLRKIKYFLLLRLYD